MTEDFKPDWVSPPSDTVKDILQEREITRAEFGALMLWTEQQVSAFLNNEVKIDEEIAKRLELAFSLPGGVGTSTAATRRFWLQRQKHYDEGAQRIAEEGSCAWPQSVEVLIYENRHGHHVVVVKANGKEREAVVRDFVLPRRSLSREATLQVVGRLIRELEALE